MNPACAGPGLHDATLLVQSKERTIRGAGAAKLVERESQAAPLPGEGEGTDLLLLLYSVTDGV
ncbi:MAG: hypothetical protein KDM81_11480 [Verrucomicrobiae bacterium]|nr:hypothetical protein [Verrucomicrobiae bacterium]